MEAGENMKRKILILIFAAIFVWGIYKALTKSDEDLKNVGDVTIVCDDVSCEIKGNKLLKQYEEKITNFDCPSLEEIAPTLVSIKKPDQTGNKKDELDLYVKYKGDFIDKQKSDIQYTVYDSQYNELYKSDTLDIRFDDGKEYYVGVDVKWGRVKNYVCMRYYFKITT